MAFQFVIIRQASSQPQVEILQNEMATEVKNFTIQKLLFAISKSDDQGQILTYVSNELDSQFGGKWNMLRWKKGAGDINWHIKRREGTLLKLYAEDNGYLVWQSPEAGIKIIF